MKKLLIILLLFMGINIMETTTQAREMVSWVSQLQVRSAPNFNSKIIDSLEKYQSVKLLNKTSKKEFSANLQGLTMVDNFIFVETKKGLKGWVYKGGLALLTAEFDFNKPSRITGPKDSLIISTYKSTLKRYKRLKWYGIFDSKTKFAVKRVNLIFKTNVADNFTYLDVTDLNVKPMHRDAIFFFSPAKRIKSDYSYIDKPEKLNEVKKLKTSGKIDFVFKNHKYRISLMKNNNFIRKGYNDPQKYQMVLVQWQSGKTFYSQFISAAKYSEIFWMGDITGDNRLDFLVKNSSKYVTDIHMFISSGKSKLVHQGSFTPHAMHD